MERINADAVETLTLLISSMCTVQVTSLIIPFSFRIQTFIVPQTDSKTENEKIHKIGLQMIAVTNDLHELNLH
jgi:hypothetical protein